MVTWINNISNRKYDIQLNAREKEAIDSTDIGATDDIATS